MTTTATVSSSSDLNALLGNSSTSTSSTDPSDRFLKLLVTQMQNQDPLNPMDNAQVTSQMAQISTVSGLDKLNTTISQMSTLMLQAQSLQGAALVGKSVLVEGNDLATDAAGKGSAGFDLAQAAKDVVVRVTDSSGALVDTIDLGEQASGRHRFDWQAPSAAEGNYHFTVSARSGTTKITATPLAADRVAAVYTDGKQLTVELERHGDLGYADVKAVF